MVEQLFCNLASKAVIYKYVSYFYKTNCYFIEDPISDRLIIIDPGGFISEVFYFLENKKHLQFFILITHEHFDHHISLGIISKLYDVTVLKPNSDFFGYINDERTNISYYSNYFLPHGIGKQKNIKELDGFQLIDTPGHSKQSYCYLYDNLCFSGDTIIKQEFMVLKLPGSSKLEFEKSKDKLIEILNSESLILPGHGECFLFNKWYLWKK